jgi:hypothetical protein
LQAAALAAAQSVNAKYVSIENRYMYDSSKPMTEASPVAPVSRKGALRQKMAEEVMAAHTRGDVRATAAVGTHDRAFGQTWITPHARASVEMMYEFTAPCVVDSSRIEREFSLSATPSPAAIERTIAWYRDHLSNSMHEGPLPSRSGLVVSWKTAGALPQSETQRSGLRLQQPWQRSMRTAGCVPAPWQRSWQRHGDIVPEVRRVRRWVSLQIQADDLHGWLASRYGAPSPDGDRVARGGAAGRSTVRWRSSRRFMPTSPALTRIPPRV